MTWRFRYRKQAFIFLKDNELLEEVKHKILDFIHGKRVDVKKLKGNWEGFLRLRIGKIRVIFKLDADRKIVEIYKAGFRGKVYKK